MHHKFLEADGRDLATGSFNWTKAAIGRNDENLVVFLGEVQIASAFAVEFERLWNDATRFRDLAPVPAPAALTPAPTTPRGITQPEAVPAAQTRKVVCWDGTEAEIPAWANFIGNKGSGKFHRLTCQYVPGRKNHLYFKARAEAIAAGQVPCKVCNP